MENQSFPTQLLELESQAGSLRHLLQTNLRPSDVEIHQLRQLLLDIQAVSSGLHLQPLNDTTVNVEGHPALERIETLQYACTSAISKLRQLPAEILSIIFSYTLPDPHRKPFDGLWTSSLDNNEAPWILSRVSRPWREIVLAHQEMWASIRMNYEQYTPADNLNSESLKLQLCLKRSGNYPLSVTFKDSYAPTDAVSELFVSLLSHSHRWRKVTLFLSFEHLELTRSIKGRVPLLKHICLVAYGANTFGSFDTFSLAPQLRSAWLAIGDPGILILPWSQLAELDGEIIDSMNILHLAPNLQEFDLVFNPTYIIPTPAPNILHQNLKRLKTNLAFPLTCLKTPSLEYLHINGRGDEPEAIGHITSFIHRSSCLLQSLSLFHITLSDPLNISSLFQSTPALTRLKIKYGAVRWPTLAHVLTLTHSQLVTKLANVTFVFGRTPAINLHGMPDESLLEMLESRCRIPDTDGDAGVSHLKSVTLSELPVPIPSLMMSRLILLMDMGLTVEIS